MSAFGWVDFSSEHREKVKSVIDLLSKPGVIDELGIGVIRDSFSDTLFPGISTIQTRAKYFLTVPRIFKDYEKLPTQKRRRNKLTDYLRNRENDCMEAMVRNHGVDTQRGIIGESFHDKQGEVQRKPSSVYWAGLRQFGLIRTPLSLQAFCRKFANPDQPLHDLVRGTHQTKGDDPDAAEFTNDTINSPAYADDWINELTIHLSNREASFISHQIQTRVPLSLLGQILLDPELRATFVELPETWNFTMFAEEAPFLDRLPEELQQIILAARDFWQLMSGAHILYNCLLQSRFGTLEKQQEYEQSWEIWREEMQSFPWERWDTASLWRLTTQHRRRVRKHTHRFVESWINGIRNNIETESLGELVRKQEWNNKRSRARLLPNSDEKVVNWIGISDLNYRLDVARTIITDIHAGLMIEEPQHA